MILGGDGGDAGDGGYRLNRRGDCGDREWDGRDNLDYLAVNVLIPPESMPCERDSKANGDMIVWEVNPGRSRRRRRWW